jgi:polyphosphate kinase 2 (PPK2 family)
LQTARKEIAMLQVLRVKTQHYIKHASYRLIHLFEGRNAAGEDDMLEQTNLPESPWFTVKTDDQRPTLLT